MARGLLVLLALGLLGTLAVVGCSSKSRHHQTDVVIHDDATGPGHGPPPHAPAHGYRHRTAHGHDLAYDARLKVYVVVGRTDHYYATERYYRRADGGWEVSLSLQDSWEPIADTALPHGLKVKGKEKGKGKKKGHKPAPQVAESEK